MLALSLYLCCKMNVFQMRVTSRVKTLMPVYIYKYRKVDHLGDLARRFSQGLQSIQKKTIF